MLVKTYRVTARKKATQLDEIVLTSTSRPPSVAESLARSRDRCSF